MAILSRLYDFLNGTVIDAEQVDAELNQLVAGVNAREEGNVVSSLPGSPYDGQVVSYLADATNGTVWRLKYRAGSASAYKWEFVGGSALVAEIATSEGTASTTYTALATAGPSVTVPLAGDYDVEISALGSSSGTDNEPIMMSFDTGATAAIDGDAASTGSFVATYVAQLGRTRRKTGVAAASAITAKYRSNKSPQTVTFKNRRLSVRPIRVG